MDNEPKKWAIIIVGPPGSGKDTQAELLAHELKFEQIKSSVLIEKKFAEADPNDEAIQREKEIKYSGGLMSSERIARWLGEEITRIGKENKGLILTGGLRREIEADATMAILEQYYKKEDIKIIEISISPESTVRRNSGRRVCQLNQHPILNTPENANISICPLDGSPIISRQDDDPQAIQKRIHIYYSEIKPILDFLIKKGYNLITIDGERSIEDVHRDILDKLW